jgi:protein-S-isoprenylcysteine O-methyltransferase Ste14
MKRIIKSVAIGAGLLLVVFLARPNPLSLVVGGVIVLFGEAIRVWASGHLFRNRELTTSGPYAHLRDPLYLGRLLLLVGFCVMGWGYTWIILVLGLLVFFLNYMPRKYKKEMVGLEKIFGEEYKRYSSYASSLIPRLKPYPHADKKRWQFDLFWKVNREQYFIVGAIVLSLAIVGRYWYL